MIFSITFKIFLDLTVLLLTCPEVMNFKKRITGIRLRFENRVRRQKTCALDLINKFVATLSVEFQCVVSTTVTTFRARSPSGRVGTGTRELTRTMVLWQTWTTHQSLNSVTHGPILLWTHTAVRHFGPMSLESPLLSRSPTRGKPAIEPVRP